MAFSTMHEFCRTYGAHRFAELVTLLNDPAQTHASIGQRFGVSPSCVTRWVAKFCDVHITLKPDVLDWLETELNIRQRDLNEQHSVIEGQRNELRLIKGGRANEKTAESSS